MKTSYVLRFPRNRTTATLQAPAWEESKHPRGQPENAGEFVSKGGSAEHGPSQSVGSQHSESRPDQVQSETKRSLKAEFTNMIRENKRRGISQMVLQKYEQTLHGVIDNFTEPMAKRLKEKIGDIICYRSCNQLTDEVFGADEKQTAGGCWEWTPGDDNGTLHIDGDTKGLDSAGIYAHELSHVLDFNNVHSDTPEWKEAWSEEIDKDHEPLSKYARFDAGEGLAEYGRLLGSGKTDVAKQFPKCYACFQKWGYL